MTATTMNPESVRAIPTVGRNCGVCLVGTLYGNNLDGGTTSSPEATSQCYHCHRVFYRWVLAVVEVDPRDYSILLIKSWLLRRPDQGDINTAMKSATQWYPTRTKWPVMEKSGAFLPTAQAQDNAETKSHVGGVHTEKAEATPNKALVRRVVSVDDDDKYAETLWAKFREGEIRDGFLASYPWGSMEHAMVIVGRIHHDTAEGEEKVPA